MEQYATWIIDSVSNYGVWFVIAFLFIENIPVIGFFAPGLTILVLSGFFFELITGSWLLLFLIAWLTIFIADTTWYLIGYFGQEKTAWLKRLAVISPNVKEVLSSQSPYLLVTYQFLVYFRMLLPVALGMYRYPFWHWILLCLVGSALYTAVFLGIGVASAYLFKEISLLDQLIDHFNLLLASGAAIYVYILLRRYRSILQKNDT